MKIQLASTLPFTPVQLDPDHPSPRRVVGMLSVMQDGKEFQTPVYEFRHDENDAIQYRVDPTEATFIGTSSTVDQTPASGPVLLTAASKMVWIDHRDTMTYKPYAFVVMDAMTRLVGAWDGIVYRTPSGERLRESAFQATLQIVDACVTRKDGLWVMVSINGESVHTTSMNPRAVHQMGWVPVG